MVRLHKMDNSPTPSGATPQVATTLGDILYAGRLHRGLAEVDWRRLVEAIAAGDRIALDRLYLRTHRVVYTLLVRLTSNAGVAEDLMCDLYRDLWRGSPHYSIDKGTVLGWIMNETRSRAIAHLRSEQRTQGHEGPPDGGLLAIDGPDYRQLMQAKEGMRRLRMAMFALVPEEQRIIELGFFSELSLPEIAARVDRPIEFVKAHLRSGLHKLRHALALPRAGSVPSAEINRCEEAELVCAYALGALPAVDAPAKEAHLSACRSCRRELESLRPVLENLHFWPADVLRPPASLRVRMAQYVASDSGDTPSLPVVPERQPDWEEVAPSISCKFLASDSSTHMVSMLVRLAPGGAYPPHTHAGVEELHLLDGELWIEERKLHPGDYNRAEPGTGDRRVWSETGCTCVLITSTQDVIA